MQSLGEETANEKLKHSSTRTIRKSPPVSVNIYYRIREFLLVSRCLVIGAAIFLILPRNDVVVNFGAFLMYVENLEMNNSLKWALFIKVSGQITSDTLWK